MIPKNSLTNQANKSSLFETKSESIGFKTSQSQTNFLSTQERSKECLNFSYNEEQVCVLKFVDDYFNQKQLGYKLPFNIDEKKLIDNLDKVFIKYRENLI